MPMKDNSIKILDKAEKKCLSHGSKLTPKRKLVLMQLINAEKLLSAYEIADLVNENVEKKMPVMSIYRMLDFLTSVNLVHKIDSQNKFIACKHITCDHDHFLPQFLICHRCNKVKEISLSSSVINEITTFSDFKLTNPVLEIKGECQKCCTD